MVECTSSAAWSGLGGPAWLISPATKQALASRGPGVQPRGSCCQEAAPSPPLSWTASTHGAGAEQGPGCPLPLQNPAAPASCPLTAPWTGPSLLSTHT